MTQSHTPPPRNRRATKQRGIILEALMMAEEHVTADELYDQLKERIPNLSLATVYRNLNNFVDEGLAKRLQIGGESARFEGTGKPAHHHALCDCCGNLFDIETDSYQPVLQFITQVIQEDLEFQVNQLKFLATGTCQVCTLQQSRSAIRKKVS